MNQEHEKIKILAEIQPSECSCTKCVSMCKKISCLGTPDDILRIINAGHKDKLGNVLWAAGLARGFPPIALVAPRFDYEKGQCSFLTEDNLCALHSQGLKPIEGQLATCNTLKRHGKIPLAFIVATTWTTDNNQKTIALIGKALQK